jgi:hypothetical protein
MQQINNDKVPYVVITSINPPTKAVRLFEAIAGDRLLVVGDRKSPAQWECGRARFLSADEQQQSRFNIARGLPWNHYSRKMLGYLWAMNEGAALIADTDDDNEPYDNWTFPDFQGEFLSTADNIGYVNIYSLYSDTRIWPRGLPLKRVLDPAAHLSKKMLLPKPSHVGVWQALADDDPDVDAIYRLTVGTPCKFKNEPPVVLGTGTYCPFNSQNTLFSRQAFPLLYMPAYVTFRFTDILRGIVAQIVLQASGLSLGFCHATVRQERNPHDYMKDFESELPCYLQTEPASDAVIGAVVKGDSVKSNLFRAYAALKTAKVVTENEIKLLDSWLKDIDAIGK